MQVNEFPVAQLRNDFWAAPEMNLVYLKLLQTSAVLLSFRVLTPFPSFHDILLHVVGSRVHAVSRFV